jgi:Carboxymuconolactone decarboxylase family
MPAMMSELHSTVTTSCGSRPRLRRRAHDGEPRHAGYALNIGVSEEELKEIIYMVTVPAGFSRAIAASQALAELFAERRNAKPGGDR